MHSAGPGKLRLHRRWVLKALAALPLALAGRPLWAAAPLRCVFGDDYPPWSWGGGREVRGLAPELVLALLADVPALATVAEGFPWKRAQQLVSSGQADLLCTIPTPERRGYALVSAQPIFSTRMRVYAARSSQLARGLTEAGSLDDVRASGARFVTYLGAGWTADALAGTDLHFVPTFTDCLRTLAAGYADAMIDSEMVVRYHRRELGLVDDVLEGHTPLAQSDFHPMIARRSPYAALMTKIDGAMAAFRDSPAYSRILTRYGQASA